jgi:peptidoglycan-associated lipoprotein
MHGRHDTGADHGNLDRLRNVGVMRALIGAFDRSEVSPSRNPSYGTHFRDGADMNIKLLGAFAAVALLSACANKPQTTGASTGTGASALTGAPTPGSEEDLVKNVGDRVFFAFDKSGLAPEARTTLDHQAAWLAQYPQVNVLVAGNTDERGTEEYNLALGQRRANSARDYLVARGTSSQRIQTISYGKNRPVAPGSNEEAWAQNRNAITSVQGFNPQGQ